MAPTVLERNVFDHLGGPSVGALHEVADELAVAGAFPERSDVAVPLSALSDIPGTDIVLRTVIQ